MKIDLGTLVNSTAALRKLSESSMKALTAYKIAKLLTKIEEEVANFEQVRAKLITELGESDDSGDIVVPQENYSKFFEELQTILNQEVEIVADKLKIGDLINTEGKEIDISPDTIQKLQWMLDE